MRWGRNIIICNIAFLIIALINDQEWYDSVIWDYATVLEMIEQQTNE